MRRRLAPAMATVAPASVGHYIREAQRDRLVSVSHAIGAMKPSHIGRWARWGWLATTIAMGAALLATAWVGRQRVTQAASTLNRGQGEVLLETARQVLRTMAPPLDLERLDSLLLQQQAAGLRYIGLVDGGGSILGQAGTPVSAPPAPPSEPSPRPPVLERVGNRLRMLGIARLGPPPEGTERPRERVRPALLVIEFEPVIAERLGAEATRTFVLSALVAAALLAAAFVFWRLSIRQELAERRLEQQRRLGVLGEMSAVLAHEIRNPLASLKGHAQLLAERLGDETADGHKAVRVVQEAERLEALTADLLDFARSGPIDIRPTDPVALLHACVDEVDPGGFVVHADDAPESWPLDAGRMRQALTNVLRNARQASPGERQPDVALARANGALVFAVRDYGAGIIPGDEKRIFSPFYTTRTLGTGLGLAVALRVAELHGGTITATNHPDGGAVFRITIPRT
jgi:two-component system sensor histidine kinase HydH